MDDKKIMMNLNFDDEWVKRNEEEAYEKNVMKSMKKPLISLFYRQENERLEFNHSVGSWTQKNDLKHWKHS